MATINLSLLPAPTVVEVLDYEALLAERKATLISLYPEAGARGYQPHTGAGVRTHREAVARKCLS
jgi:phage-related baseplate assembly protein